MANRRRRNRARANRAVQITTTKELTPFVPAKITMQKIQRVPKLKKRKNLQRRRGNPITRLSPAGIDMLKCAFAAPDFGVDPGQGIVDKFQGRVINVKDAATETINFEAGADTYILVLPIPGYRYFIGVAQPGQVPIDYVGVPYPTYETNFGDGKTENNNYTRFRYAGGAVGLYPTSNMMQFAGSIQAWRIDANMSDTLFDSVVYDKSTGFQVQKVNIPAASMDMGTFTVQGTSGKVDVQLDITGPDHGVNHVSVAEHAGEVEAPTYIVPSLTNVARNTVQRNITGLASITTAAPRDSYNDSFIKGAFAVMTDRTDDFEWTDFTTADNYTDGNKRIKSADGKPLKGLGNLNGILFKVSSPQDSTNSALLRTWCCIEMQPNTNSSIYQFSKKSPMHDPLALQLYHDYASRMPVAVPCAMNAFSWESFMRFAEKALSVMGRYAPVVGQGLTFASDVIGAINSLVF